MLAEGPDSTMEIIIRFLRFTIPVTMLVCAWIMRAQYYRYKQYQKVPFFALLPLLPIGMLITVENLLDYFR